VVEDVGVEDRAPPAPRRRTKIQRITPDKRVRSGS
jgi:hypothetical protein